MDNRLTQAGIIAIPIKRNEKSDLNPQPNWLVITNLYGITTSNIEGGNETSELIELSGLPELSQEINVYPNPTNEDIFINLSGFEGEHIEIKVYDLMGRIVYKNLVQESKAEYKISTAGMQNGFYIIKITEEGEIINTTKIAVQK